MSEPAAASLPASSPASPTPKVDYCLQQAQSAKAAGNAALQSGNPRSAAFQYKKVYLFLAEYLPADVKPPSASTAAATGGGGGNDGLVQMLQQKKRRPGASTQSSSPSTSSPQPAISPAVQQAALALYATSLNNLALAHLKLGRYREGVACVDAILNTPALRAALDIDAAPPALPTSTTPLGKALLRRASCLVKLGEWVAAAADVQALTEAHAAANVAPDAACAQLTEAIAAGRKTEKEKEKTMMRRMFA